MVDRTRRRRFTLGKVAQSRPLRQHSQTRADQSRVEIAESVLASLERMPDAEVQSLAQMERVGERMVHLIVPKKNELAEIVGELYSTKALESMWGVGRAAISNKVRDGKLLAVKIGHQNYFPLFQFEGTTVRKDVLEIVNMLNGPGDPWSIAAWMRLPSAYDDRDRTPLELLDAGNGDLVRAEASDLRRAWSA